MMLEYAQKLGFNEKPDYDYIRSIILNSLVFTPEEVAEKAA